MPQEIAPRELARRLINGHAVRLIDVRQPWENEKASLPDSILIPLNELPQRTEEVGRDTDAFVVVYCHHGIRSLSAVAYLERLGLQNVYSLAGGIDAWSCEVDPAIPRY